MSEIDNTVVALLREAALPIDQALNPQAVTVEQLIGRPATAEEIDALQQDGVKQVVLWHRQTPGSLGPLALAAGIERPVNEEAENAYDVEQAIEKTLATNLRVINGFAVGGDHHDGVSVQLDLVPGASTNNAKGRVTQVEGMLDGVDRAMLDRLCYACGVPTQVARAITAKGVPGMAPGMTAYYREFNLGLTRSSHLNGLTLTELTLEVEAPGEGNTPIVTTDLWVTGGSMADLHLRPQAEQQ